MSPTSEIYAYILEKVVAEPLPRQIRLYRALAALIGEETQSRSLLAFADELQQIERMHSQLLLDLGHGGPDEPDRGQGDGANGGDGDGEKDK